MRLIDADELMKALGITDMDCEKCEWQRGYGTYFSRGGYFEDACFAIENAPTIEPERKMGEWKNVGFLTCQCSECGAQFHELEYTNYCPNCGADMRDQEGEE